MPDAVGAWAFAAFDADEVWAFDGLAAGVPLLAGDGAAVVEEPAPVLLPCPGALFEVAAAEPLLDGAAVDDEPAAVLLPCAGALFEVAVPGASWDATLALVAGVVVTVDVAGLVTTGSTGPVTVAATGVAAAGVSELVATGTTGDAVAVVTGRVAIAGV